MYIPLATGKWLFLPSPVAGPSRQLRQRELVPVSETTSDTLSCTLARPHQRDSAGFFLHLFNRLKTVLCSSGGRGSASHSRVLAAPCRSRPRQLSCGRILVFSVSQGDVFLVFSLFMDLLSGRKEEKKKKKKRGEPRHWFY